MLGDDDVGDDVEKSGFSSREIISLVRRYWGHEDYVAPIDRPQLPHAAPGHRNAWQEDNYSSLLEMFGLYAPRNQEAPDSQAQIDNNFRGEGTVPMSLDNEPPSTVRNDQNSLSQYLSTKTNPSGVKACLSLLPCKSNTEVEMGMIDADELVAGYETECTLPANTSMETLRALCQGSDAQCLRRDLAESDADFSSISSSERIRTKSWNEDCRWTVSFADSEDDIDAGDAASQMTVLGDGSFFDPRQGNDTSASQEASKALRHNTAIHSSWTYFPESVVNTPTASHLGSTGNAVAASASSSSNASSPSTESLQIQRLQHQIETLEHELNDPSSLRDRDSMHDELKLAKRELRGLKPWWGRYWGQR